MENGCLDEQLRQILAEQPASVRERERAALELLLRSVQNRVVLCGAGNLGRRALGCLRSIGVSPLAFSDNDCRLWNSEVEGCPVLPLPAAASRFGADALFIVTIWNANHYYGVTKQQLVEHGCKHIASISAVFWRFTDHFLPFVCQDLPSKLYERKDDVIAASKLWSDEQSCRIYKSQIRWRTLGDCDSFMGPDPEESYFPASIFQLSPEEHFVDCGAFDGDTIRSFVARRGPDFASILAIEADALTFPKLRSFVDRLAPALKCKITPLQIAVGAERRKIRFSDTGGVDSCISGTGTSEVECFRLDDLLHDRPASYIKMDIEGAECDALVGAVKTIRRHRPVLSVCVYHAQSHIWSVPLFINEYAPNYMFFLREHEGDGRQTVLYAVPVERVERANWTVRR